MSALAVAPVPTGSWLDDATIEGNLVNIVIAQAIQTARLTRAIDEASTVTLGILDPARELLGSPLWKQASRLKADAKTYVLVQTRKQARKFTLTFEDETVYKLRQPDTYQASRGNETWVDFITRLCKQSGIKVYAPEVATAIGLNTRVPNRGATPPDNVPRDAPSGTTGSFEASTTPTVTNHGQPNAGARPWTPANGEQLRSMIIALNVATDLCAKNHLSQDMTVVALAMMLATGSGESGWYKASKNDAGYEGIFAQGPDYTAPHDVAIATHELMVGRGSWGPPKEDQALGTRNIIGILRGVTNFSDQNLGRLIGLAQGSDQGADYYADFLPEARQNVAYWTGTPTTATPAAITTATPGLTGQWQRGKAQQYETTWDCAKRLSSDQGYRCFVGPGDPLNVDEDILWLVTDQWLINRPAAAVLHENVGAIETIDWEIDQGRRRPAGSSQRAPMDTCTVTALDTWDVEPGSVARLAGEGPADGRWLVTRWERDAVKPDSTITLGKPIEKLPPPDARPATSPLPAARPGQIDPGAPLPGSTDIPLPGTTELGRAVAQWAIPYAPSLTGPWGYSYGWGAKHGVPLSTIEATPHPPPPFDCSSFVRWGWGAVGHIDIAAGGPADNTFGQIEAAKRRKGVLWGGSGSTPRGGWQPGDIVYTSGGEHVVLMINATECVNAKGHAYGIVREPLTDKGPVHFWARWTGVVT